jgi:Cof subfamily protein (haloacid dehalogenase superfamily)
VKRLVFLDVDGTLLTHDQELPDSARNALTRAVSLGHRLVLCTGRTQPEIYPFLWDLGMSGLVGCNGAYGEVDGRVLFNDQLPSQDVAELSAWFEANRVDCLWQTGVELHPSRNFLDRFRTSGDAGRSIAGNWSAFLAQIEPALRPGVPQTAAKVTFFIPSDSPIRLSDVQGRFGARFSIIPGSLPQEQGETGELTALGMNKSVGLTRIAEHFGVPVEETIAIGDSANDIEMLAVAGTGVAMGNGTAQAQAAADWITSSIEHDGLALAFEKLGLLD